MQRWYEWLACGSRSPRRTEACAAWRTSLVISLLFLIVQPACAPRSPEEPDTVYIERLGGVLDADLVVPAVERGSPWPPRRALTVPVAPLQIDAIQFVALHECDLGGLAGYRNSPLGRMQSASQRLGYEAEWLRVAARCEDPPDWLADLVDEKRAALPALFWNATLSSDEFRVAAGASLPGDATAFAYQVERLRAHYAALLRNEFDVDAFENDLGLLARESVIGSARARWSRQRAVLDTARQAVVDNVTRLCRNGRPTPRARYLTNVFARFYVARLQPMLAREHAVDAAWIEALLALALDQAELARPRVSDWFRDVIDPDHPRSEWARTRAAVIAHADAWQALFARCGIDPRAIAEAQPSAGTMPPR